MWHLQNWLSVPQYLHTVFQQVPSHRWLTIKLLYWRKREARQKILCLLSVKSHWMLNPPLPRKRNYIYQVPFSCLSSIFVNVPFIPSPALHPTSISCPGSRLLPCSIQREWHLDPSCVPVSRSNVCKTLLCMFQGTQAFYFRVLAMLLSLATKLQVQGEQQVSVSVFKHELCVHFSCPTLNSNVFPTTQKGCVSIVVL